MVVSTKNIVQVILDFTQKGVKNISNSVRNFNSGLKEIERNNSNFIQSNSKLDNSLRQQQSRLLAVSNRIRTSSAELNVLKKQNKNLTSTQQSGITTRERNIANLKKQRAQIANNVGSLKESIRGNLLSSRTTEMNNIANLKGSGVLGLSNERYKAFIDNQGKFNTLSGKVANKVRRVTAGFKGFRMELLGVMFFGMAMQRVFTGLIKTSLDWVGVTEIMTAALGILFLPVAELILNWALFFLDVVTNLTPAQKKWIGAIVLTGIAIGALLFVVGTLGLGIGSLIIAFGALLTPIGLVLAGFGALAGFFILKGFFKDLSSQSDELKGKLVTLGVSAEVFDKIKDKVILAFDSIKEFFSGFGENIATFISANIPKVIESGGNLLIALVNGVKNNVGKIGPAITNLINKMVDFISENSSDIISAGLDILDSLLKGITDNLDDIGEVMDKLIAAISTWVTENSSALIDIGKEIFKSIANGIVLGALNVGASIGNAINKVLGSETKFKFESGGGEAGARLVQIPQTPKRDLSRSGITERPDFGNVFNITNNTDVKVSDKSEFLRIIDEMEKKQADVLLRLGVGRNP